MDKLGRAMELKTPLSSCLGLPKMGFMTSRAKNGLTYVSLTPTDSMSMKWAGLGIQEYFRGLGLGMGSKYALLYLYKVDPKLKKTNSSSKIHTKKKKRSDKRA